MVITIIFFIVFLLVLLQIVFLFIRKKNFKTHEKISPFECGFYVFFSRQVSITVQFFIIRVVFLIFDIELLLLFPYFFRFHFLEINLGLRIFLFFIRLTFIFE